MMSEQKKYHIGCQSWGYDDWVTPAGGDTIFYPRGTRRDEMLGLYSRVFNTIEVDSTLYGIPSERTFENWYSETPAGFLFSLKFPREITHDLGLRGRSISIMNEFVGRADRLREKLGVFLIQFPASFDSSKENALALRRFLAAIPSGYKFAVEFRNAGWFVEWTLQEMERACVALCLTEGKWVKREIMFDAAAKVAVPFGYVRIMGKRDLKRFDRIYRHRDDVLEAWTGQIEKLAAQEIMIYVDNYFEGFAPATANKLLERLNLRVGDPARLDSQGSLF